MQNSVRRDDSRRVHVHTGTRTHEYYALYIVYNQVQQTIDRDLWRRKKCPGFATPNRHSCTLSQSNTNTSTFVLLRMKLPASLKRSVSGPMLYCLTFDWSDSQTSFFKFVFTCCSLVLCFKNKILNPPPLPPPSRWI